jgi:hypothetical protein
MLPHIWGPNKLAKYASTTEAIDATISVFCDGLEKALCGAGQHTVLVHPVRPTPRDHPGDGVAAARRTQAWHIELRRRLRDLPRVIYLDFFDELCCVAGGIDSAVCERCGGSVAATVEDVEPPWLCRAFDIGDGVHMNREYMHMFVRHVREAIAQLSGLVS